jgi:putative hydrolase of HD superfamily
MISQLDEPCWTISPVSDTSDHHPSGVHGISAAVPPPGGPLLTTAVLASPCWTAACDHPGCGALFLEDGDPDAAAVMHAPGETVLRAWLTAGGWAHRQDGRAWCHEHQADRGILEAAAAVTRHAATFARTERAVVTLPDGTAETDSDHAAHLAWLAPAIAAATEPGLDPVLVSAYAAVHDAVEVFAGDTPTITITDAERARKHDRETAARWLWHDSLDVQLPWLPGMIDRYESQEDPEARFVKAADKVAPKLVHYLNGARDLHAAGVTPGQFSDMTRGQRAALGQYAAEFTALLVVYDQVIAAVHQALTELAGSKTAGGGGRG